MQVISSLTVRKKNPNSEFYKDQKIFFCDEPSSALYNKVNSFYSKTETRWYIIRCQRVSPLSLARIISHPSSLWNGQTDRESDRCPQPRNTHNQPSLHFLSPLFFFLLLKYIYIYIRCISLQRNVIHFRIQNGDHYFSHLMEKYFR